MKKLFLLDAFALIYRAHFAFSKNPRINSKGMNTGAVLGFTNTLLDIINNEKPTHIGVAFDTSAPTFRHVTFDAYKAQRQEQPEDITIAVPYIKRLCTAFQIPILELDGYEADDIIGTIAKKAEKGHYEVYMMTPDKDYAQLVDEHIFLYKPAYLGNEVDKLGVKEVLAKWEIQNVNQVTDILGLQGDAVDNIPGIPGIGAKTAVKLIAEFGSVENLVANADKLKGKQKENVEQFGQQGILSKQLATIDTNVPIEFDEETLRYKGFNPELLKSLFDELEFRTLSRKLFGDSDANSFASDNIRKDETTKSAKAQKNTPQTSLFGSENSFASDNTHKNEEFETLTDSEVKSTNNEQPTTKQNIDTVLHDYHLIDTPELRKSLIHFLSLQDEFCFDTETTSTDPYESELVGISFAYLKNEAFYVPIPENQAEAKNIVQEFKSIFENPSIKKIGQNIKYDVIVLKSYDIDVQGISFDTMLAHYLIDPDTRHNMDVLAENYLNYSPVSIETLIGKGKNQGSMREVDVEKVAEYAAEDADITFQLKNVFVPILKKDNLEELFNKVEMPLVEVLAEVERNGVKIDVGALNLYSRDLEKELKDIEQSIYNLAGEPFNVSSPQQMGKILFEKLKLMDKPKKTKTGQYATGEEILATLTEHQIVREIQEYRQMLKLKSTYIDALPTLVSKKDGLIHTSYNQAVAATGRLSSNNPNLQNIPIRTERGKEIRKAFVPRSQDFIIVSADYSQVELRIMASFSKDAAMVEAFKQGKDIHTATASKIFKVPENEVSSDMRRKAKTANFGIIYGISAHGLSQRLNIPRKEAAQIIDAYFAEFPAVKTYMDEVIQFAQEHEYVETMLGRRRYLRDINSRNFTQKSFAERNAINAPIQGSAADIIKLAMINIHAWLKSQKLKSKMIMQVHDELVFDIYLPEYDLISKKIKELMENAFQMEVPLVVEVGKGENWLEAH
ncbi:DNA polymerase I [Thermoflexibacter ruber]|uniref:DNA polymerase I n=1 Tax=Thermoflexibacter ruber TaxID=1003 RepID=A0A1I2JP17_9BACT|nr:DNA polymerase I [Thermoflexibacter ruber]SFF54516.1 DNA polymerase I [Thermoflexibacter ruber]